MLEGDAITLHDRLVYSVVCLIVRKSLVNIFSCMLQGRTVQVALINGTVYEGLLHAVDTEKDFSVTLSMATKKTKEKSGQRPIESVFIQGKDVLQLFGQDVELLSHPGGAAGQVASGFRTDNEISGADGTVYERQLQPWMAQGGDALETDAN